MPPLRLLRLANPFVRLVLRSPLHGLLSERLLVLTYRGRRTGEQYEIPLRYVAGADGRLVAVAVRPERKLWWRSLVEPTPVFLLLRGERLAAMGSVAAGPEREAALAAYLGATKRGVRLTEDAAVVVFAPRR